MAKIQEYNVKLRTGDIITFGNEEQIQMYYDYGRLHIEGDVLFHNAINFQGSITFPSDITVVGQSVFDQTVIFNGNSQFNGDYNTMEGELLVQDDVNIGQTLTVQGETSLSSRMDINDEAWIREELLIGSPYTSVNKSHIQLNEGNNNEYFIQTPWTYTSTIEDRDQKDENYTLISLGDNYTLSEPGEIALYTYGDKLISCKGWAVDPNLVTIHGKQFVDHFAEFRDDVTIRGNLTVWGGSTVIDTTQLSVEDNLIYINKNEEGNGVTEGIAGFKINRGTLNNADLIFDESDDRWVFKYDGPEQYKTDIELQNIIANEGIYFPKGEIYPATGIYSVPGVSGSRLNIDSLHTKENGAGELFIEGSEIFATDDIRIGYSAPSPSGYAEQMVQIANQLEVEDTVRIDEYLEHLGDPDTFLRFYDNGLVLRVNGIDCMTLDHAEDNIINIGSLDIDNIATDIEISGTKTTIHGPTVLDNSMFDTNSTFDIISKDSYESIMSLYGMGGGTGRLFIGEHSLDGGGLEYNGDGIPASTGAGSKYITLFRRNGNENYWTARNHKDNNDWEFRGNVEVNSFSSNDNFILDENGNLTVEGTLTGNDNVTFTANTTLSNSDSAFTVENTSTFNNDVTLSNESTDITTTNFTLSSSSSNTISGTTTLNDNVTIDANLTVTGNETIQSNLSVSGSSTFEGDSTFKSNIYYPDGSIEQTTGIKGIESLEGSQLNLDRLHTRPNGSGQMWIEGNQINFTDTLLLGNESSREGVTTGSDVKINNNLEVGNNTTIYNNLSVSGTSTFNNVVGMNNDVNFINASFEQVTGILGLGSTEGSQFNLDRLHTQAHGEGEIWIAGNHINFSDTLKIGDRTESQFGSNVEITGDLTVLSNNIYANRTLTHRTNNNTKLDFVGGNNVQLIQNNTNIINGYQGPTYNHVHLGESSNTNIDILARHLDLPKTIDGDNTIFTNIDKLQFNTTSSSDYSNNSGDLILQTGGFWVYRDGSYRQIWDEHNDGHNSGLNADKLDGLQLNQNDLNNAGDVVVRTNSSGNTRLSNLQINYSGISSTLTGVFVEESTNGWVEKCSLSHLRNQIGVTGNNVTNHYHTRLYSTSHTSDYYLYNEYDGTYWHLQSNHSNGVRVARADEAGQAYYADLSEYYKFSDYLDAGMVVKISSNDNDEIEMCDEDCCECAFGVVSENGFALNGGKKDDPDYKSIALTGKVKVKISGIINKGEQIVGTYNGCARKIKDKMEKLDKIGYALETKDYEDVDFVTCIIK